MRIKIEITGLLFGIIGQLVQLFILFNWKQLGISLREFFRGGNPGGIVVGWSMLIGFLSVGFLVINLLSKKTEFWFIRLALVIIFFVCLLILAPRV